MTPYEFITKWRASALTERSASHQHFLDLCDLLGEPKPADADPSGESYCFERGARKDSGGDGWADVWKRHHVAWEYKGKRANLDAAFEQLRQYALELDNPPLLIVSDMLRFRIRTNWTNSVSRTHSFDLDDLADAATRDKLKWAFSDPARLRPGETRRPAGKWIVDFGLDMSVGDAALYEEPFRWVKEHVWPTWDKQREAERRTQWWLHHRPRPNMWAALGELSRYIATPRVAKYRLFVWLDARVCPDSATIAIARDDDTTFGILHSRFHEIWSLRLGTWLGKGNDPRYTPTTTFETFPFPRGLTPDILVADYADDPRSVVVALEAQRLVELRDRWLNPPEWVEWVDEPVPRLSEATGSPRRRRGEGAQEAHADEPLQRPAAMARRCARGS